MRKVYVSWKKDGYQGEWTPWHIRLFDRSNTLCDLKPGPRRQIRNESPGHGLCGKCLEELPRT